MDRDSFRAARKMRATLDLQGGDRVLTFVRRMFHLAMLAIVAGGCGSEDERDVDMSRPSESGFQSSVRTMLMEEGKAAYLQYCVGCHGPEGDGKGEAARFLSPRPRNFQLANFKFSSRRSGRLPTDDDLKRTITEGLKGTAMSGWDLMPGRSVEALVAYIKTFSPKWTQRKPAARIPFVADPYHSQADKTEAIRRGEVVYHGFATCWTCHPAYVAEYRINEHLTAMENPTRKRFRPDLFDAEVKPNGEGERIYPPDFKRDYVRAGADVVDLYRSIAAGITGTAMPTWVDSMEYAGSDGAPLVATDDIWAMAYYVQHLVMQRPATLTEGEFVVRTRPATAYLLESLPPVTETPAQNQDEGFPGQDEFDGDE